MPLTAALPLAGATSSLGNCDSSPWADSDHGTPTWFASDDPTLEREAEVFVGDGTDAILRVARLRAGAIATDVTHSDDDHRTLVMEVGHAELRLAQAMVLVGRELASALRESLADGEATPGERHGENGDPDVLLTAAEVGVILGVDHKTLRALARATPSSLVGAPVLIGTGKRQHYRWLGATLTAWLTAAASWQALPKSSKPAARSLKSERANPPAPATSSSPVDWGAVGRGKPTK